VLQLDKVRKVFPAAPEPYVALDGVDLDVADGEILCLLGPSGCGKSTLLNMLAGFERPSAGSVSCGGAPIRGAGRDRVMFFQDAGSALFPWLNVEENVRFGLRVRKVPKAQWAGIIDNYLRMVDLDRHRNKFPAQLSGGMRQRLQIARALDALTRRRMHAVLLEIWQRTGKTIVFVTHDIAEAITLGDRIGIMSAGPCSIISKIIDLDLPRPRDLADPAVARLFNDIERLLAPDIARAEERAAH
jgi:NitT/TauT family transport system ATP-binding protein